MKTFRSYTTNELICLFGTQPAQQERYVFKSSALLVAGFMLAFATGLALAEFEQTTTSPLPLVDSGFTSAFDVQMNTAPE